MDNHFQDLLKIIWYITRRKGKVFIEKLRRRIIKENHQKFGFLRTKFKIL